MNSKNFYPLTLNIKVLLKKHNELRDKFVNFTTQKLFFKVIKFFNLKPRIKFSVVELSKLPENTLGNKVGNVMLKNNHEFIRGFEDHDFKHLLYDYPTTLCGEARLFYFDFFTGNRNFETIGSVLLGILLVPDSWKYIKIEKQRAKSYKNSMKFNYNELVVMDLEKAKLFVRK